MSSVIKGGVQSDSVSSHEPGAVTIGISETARDILHRVYQAISLNDLSDDALELSQEAIEQNSSSYTAWYWRRRCLLHSSHARTSIVAELDFIDDWCCRSPKNYQIWYHRRWLVGYILENRILSRSKLLKGELDSLDYLIGLEPKHYNAWSHRMFVADKFNLFSTDSEFEFTERLIRLDVRNNSAWSYRREALKRKYGSHSPVPQEIKFCLETIRLSLSNESPWVYLRSIPLWYTESDVQMYCEGVLQTFSGSTAGTVPSLRHLMDTLASLYENNTMYQRAIVVLEDLVLFDGIRSNAIRYRIDRIRSLMRP